jgi:ribonucleoside-diphosphate reductase beta chain
MESNHAIAYSKLVDTLNVGSYREFLEYPEMREKRHYHNNGLIVGDPQEDVSAISRSIVIGSVFGEGLQLFGSFIMLLSLVEQGYLPGMGRVVQWSMRDETVHVRGMINIHRELVSEYSILSSDGHKRELYQIARDMVELEDRFISLVYADDLELPNLPKPMLHKYIRYLADVRLQQIGLKPVFYVDSNPIPWLSKFEGVVHEDLFDGAGTEYTRSTFRVEEMW